MRAASISSAACTIASDAVDIRDSTRGSASKPAARTLRAFERDSFGGVEAGFFNAPKVLQGAVPFEVSSEAFQRLAGIQDNRFGAREQPGHLGNRRARVGRAVVGDENTGCGHGDPVSRGAGCDRPCIQACSAADSPSGTELSS